MCVQFDIDYDFKTLVRDFELQLSNELIPPKRIYPKDFAPVLVSGSESNTQLKTMHFSLIPNWAKERKIKFATHNARLDSTTKTGVQHIFEKPTWRAPFKSNHCLLPFKRFYESSHEGEYRGNMISFESSESEYMLAAGIFDEWLDRSTGEVVESFAILTDDPNSFIEKCGHDRSPVFLEHSNALQWLTNSWSSPREAYQFLKNQKVYPAFKVTIDRKLKSYS